VVLSFLDSAAAPGVKDFLGHYDVQEKAVFGGSRINAWGRLILRRCLQLLFSEREIER
jgi:hypothetical protein